jgi:hypothetical protein
MKSSLDIIDMRDQRSSKGFGQGPDFDLLLIFFFFFFSSSTFSLDKSLIEGSIPARGGFYPERIRFVLGTTGFLLSSFSLRFQDDKTLALAVTVLSIKPLFYY